MYADLEEQWQAPQKVRKTFALRGGARRAPQRMETDEPEVDLPRAVPPPQEVLAENAFDRMLRPSAPQTPYRRRRGELKTTLNWNDRKLALHDVEFLTKYGSGTDTVIYIGAAPGLFLPLVSQLLPSVRIVAVDHRPLLCPESKRLKIIQTQLNKKVFEELGAKYTPKSVLLISHLGPEGGGPQDPNASEGVEWVIQRQMEAVHALQPKRALLKFRLPYGEGTTKHFDGELFLPVWGTQTTTECRLVPSDSLDVKEYDHGVYEQQMFHFNTVTRVRTYPEYCPRHKDTPRHILAVEGEGYDWRYDCTSEICILLAYLRKFGTVFYEHREEERVRVERREAKRKEIEKLDREAEEKERRKGKKKPGNVPQKRERAEASKIPELDSEVKALIGRNPVDLTDDDLTFLCGRLSNDISEVLSKGKHTLATRPLTHLRPKAPEGDAPAPQPEEDVAPPAPAKPRNDVLSALGLDLGDVSDSDSSSSASDGTKKRPKAAEDPSLPQSNLAVDVYLAQLEVKSRLAEQREKAAREAADQARKLEDARRAAEQEEARLREEQSKQRRARSPPRSSGRFARGRSSDTEGSAPRREGRFSRRIDDD